MQVLQDNPGKKQTSVSYIIRLLVTVGLLALVIRNITPRNILISLSLVTPAGILAALFFQLASNSVAAFRWYLIMERIGFTHPFLFYLKSYFKGTFFNQGLPTSIGGDSIRIIDCSRNGGSAMDSLYGVFIDRIVGLAGLMLLNIGGLLFSISLLPRKIFYLLLGILVVLFSGFIILFYLRRLRLFSRGKLLGFIGRLSEKYCQVYTNGRDVLLQLGLSVLIHLLAITAFYILGADIGMTYPLQTYLALIPPVILLTILPISLAGWGIREGAMIGFFLLIGGDKSQVLSFSILYGLVVLAGSLPGLLIYLNQTNKI